MSYEQEAVKEILKGVKHMINKALSSTTRIYKGIIVSKANGDNRWVVRYNGEDHIVDIYGKPVVKDLVKVFVPQGNQSLAWAEPYKRNGLDERYPVGSVYLAVNADSPENLLGGQWEQIENITPSIYAWKRIS